MVLSTGALARETQLPLRNQLDQVDRPARWGIGFTLGEPFGLSLKRYLRGANAIDFNAAFVNGPGLRFGIDWLWGLGRIERHRKFDIDVYMGVGPFVGAFSGPCSPWFFTDRCNGEVYFGGRVPFGAELLLKEAPVSFGLELAPGLAFSLGRAGFLLDLMLVVRLLL